MRRERLRQRRRAFTLIELLVVIAIIAVIMGLLMPAVQKIRESGARLVCANNLHQIGAAMHVYHDTYGAFPPSRTANRSTTWAVLLMPQLEQENLRKQWNTRKSYFDQNQIARETSVPTYFCPSRRKAFDQLSVTGDQRVVNGELTQHVPGALGDYAVNVGTTGADFEVMWRDHWCVALAMTAPNGAFRAGDDGFNISSFRDGTSNTILVGEKHVPLDKHGYGWLDNSLYNGGNYYSIVRSGGPEFPIATSVHSERWAWGSYHLAHTQFVYADGSVHTLFNRIDRQTLGQLCNRLDGETLIHPDQ